MIPSAPSQAQGPGSAQARRFRCDVGPREVHGERRRAAWDPNHTCLAEDAIDRHRLRCRRQDGPLLPRVRQRCRAAEHRVERRHFQPDKVADDFEDIGPPLASFFAGEHDVADAIRSN